MTSIITTLILIAIATTAWAKLFAVNRDDHDTI